MAKLLLNLRHVPDDEADDVRGFLDRHRIAHYETPPGPFGITAGGIWIGQDDDVPRAKQLMAGYQSARQARVRAEHARAQEEGTADTFADLARRQPLQVALRIVAIVLLLALLAVPYFLLRA